MPEKLADSALRVMFEVIADPAFRGKAWAEAQAALRIDPAEPVEFSAYLSAQYSLWLFCRMAEFAGAGDDAGLRAFMREELPPRMAAALDAAGGVGCDSTDPE